MTRLQLLLQMQKVKTQEEKQIKHKALTFLRPVRELMTQDIALTRPKSRAEPPRRVCTLQGLTSATAWEEEIHAVPPQHKRVGAS